MVHYRVNIYDCQVIEKEVTEKDKTPWFNSEVPNAIRIRRRKEKLWHTLRMEESRREYVNARNEVNKLIRRTKSTYYRQKIVVAG